MAAAGVRWFQTLPHTDADETIRWHMRRARRRRKLLDHARTAGNWWSRHVIGYLEVRWSLAARDLRDALDMQRAEEHRQ